MHSIARVISKSLSDFPVDRRSCQLLGPTALVVQALMGILAVLSLVYKRHREAQKRPWKIWIFDVSKQVLGQMFVHGLNVLISDVGSHHSAGNACTYYFLNILLDTTLGVGLIYVVLQGSTWLFSKKLGFKGLKTGQYGNPPSVTYWVRQTAVYFFSISAMKFLLVALYAIWPGISSIGDWLLSWTGDGGSVQVIFVMGIFPMFMNIVQFWLIDSIVKASIPLPAIRSTSPRNSYSEIREPLFSSTEDDDDVPPQDIESGTRSSTSRITLEGDAKALVDAGDSNVRLLTSGSPSQMVLPKSLVAVVHHYPPNNVDGAEVPSRDNARTRHKYKRSLASPLDLPTAYSVPAVNMHDSTWNSQRQALLSKSHGGRGNVEFDTREKVDWQERSGGEGWIGLRPEQNRIHVSAR